MRDHVENGEEGGEICAAVPLVPSSPSTDCGGEKKGTACGLLSHETTTLQKISLK